VIGVVAAKSVHLARGLPHRDARGRARLIRGSAVSLIWGLACAALLWLLLPSIG